MEIKTHRELHGKEPAVGYEADTGLTPPGDQSPGRWTVRRETDSWALIFHSFVAYPVSGFYKKGFDPSPGPDYIIATFLPTEQGERAVKKMALRLVDMAWGRDEGERKTMRSCSVTQCHHNEEGLCGEPSCPLWTLYREVIGKCDICNLPMNEHPKCDGCGILTGRGHEDFSSNYRGHELCGHCINRWKALDKQVGRETTWGEFLDPELLFAFSRLGEGYHARI